MRIMAGAGREKPAFYWSRQAVKKALTSMPGLIKMRDLSTGRLLSVVDGFLHTEEVTGSNPVPPTIPSLPFVAPVRHSVGSQAYAPDAIVR